jgi:hypothetical protein
VIFKTEIVVQVPTHGPDYAPSGHMQDFTGYRLFVELKDSSNPGPSLPFANPIWLKEPAAVERKAP